MKILLAEDDPSISKLICFVLLKKQHEVISVLDGEAALAAAQSGHWDLMILDIMMPKKSGWEVLEALKERGTIPFPILLLTARGQREDQERASQLGAAQLVRKPFDPETFVKIVESHERKH